MIYFATANSPAIRAHMADGTLGMLTTPKDGRSPAKAQVWAADNGCFGKGYPGDAGYLSWLSKHSEHAPRCVFATAPDVVGDAEATLERSAPFYAPIRALGYPVALVAQDGLIPDRVPWADIDALFIGGSTDWKLGAAARLLITEAKARDLFVHIGRVNSHRRMRYAQFAGADSVDGTFLTFGPEKNLPKLRSWIRDINDQGTLPQLTEQAVPCQNSTPPNERPTLTVIGNTQTAPSIATYAPESSSTHAVTDSTPPHMPTSTTRTETPQTTAADSKNERKHHERR